MCNVNSKDIFEMSLNFVLNLRQTLKDYFWQR